MFWLAESTKPNGREENAVVFPNDTRKPDGDQKHHFNIANISFRWTIVNDGDNCHLADRVKALNWGECVEVMRTFLFFGATFLIWFYARSLWSGWKELADKYRYTQQFAGPTIHFRFALTRSGAVQSCMTFGTNATGLLVALSLPPLRFAHPTLLIPWSAVAIAQKDGWIFTHRLLLGPDQVAFGLTSDTARFILSGQLNSQHSQGAN